VNGLEFDPVHGGGDGLTSGQDGQPYEPGNISWLTDWALNGIMPGEKKREADVAGKVERFPNRSWSLEDD